MSNSSAFRSFLSIQTRDGLFISTTERGPRSTGSSLQRPLAATRVFAWIRPAERFRAVAVAVSLSRVSPVSQEVLGAAECSRFCYYRSTRGDLALYFQSGRGTRHSTVLHQGRRIALSHLARPERAYQPHIRKI